MSAGEADRNVRHAVGTPQEYANLSVLEDKGWVVSTYYDKDFKFIRQESKELKKR